MIRVDAHPVVEVEPVRRLAIGADPGVEVELFAALARRLLGDPGHHVVRVALPAMRRAGDEIVDVEEPSPRRVLTDPEPGDRGRLVAREGSGDPVARRPL